VKQLALVSIFGVSLLQDTLDITFVIIFAVEAAMKIMVYGLLLDKTAYLRSAWNVLDFVTVVVGVALACVGESGTSHLSSLRSLRTLRALRPIRVASRAPGMKVCKQLCVVSWEGLS
jgi:Ion transport protein